MIGGTVVDGNVGDGLAVVDGTVDVSLTVDDGKIVDGKVMFDLSVVDGLIIGFKVVDVTILFVVGLFVELKVMNVKYGKFVDGFAVVDEEIVLG